MRHYTSRAGDPHRHLHLQVNARVFAAGKWRGLRHGRACATRSTAINGIGHAAVMCDPEFRAALAAHGLHPDRRRRDRAARAGSSARSPKRAAQIGRNIDRYEAEWRARAPGRGAGAGAAAGVGRAGVGRRTGRTRSSRARARSCAPAGWTSWHALGYRDRDRADPARPAAAGRLDRDAAAAEVLTRLGARRSAWNAADVRGEVEQLIAAPATRRRPRGRGPSWPRTSPPGRSQLCVPLLDRAGCPSTSGRSPPSTCSTSKPTSSRGSPCAAPRAAAPATARRTRPDSTRGSAASSRALGRRRPRWW